MESKNLSEVEEIRKYVREVLMKNYPENSDILPPEVKHELERSSGKIRSCFVELLKNLQDREFSNIDKISETISLLQAWRTKIEKVIS